MLYFIGLGLADEKDITVKGLEVVQRAERVYLEAYTAVLLVGKEKLEAFYGRSVILADREMVESSADDILKDADTVDVAFLVVGDPFGATTHTDLHLRARSLHIPTSTLPNASILTSIGSTGLSLYTFGQTLSMVFFTPTWRPTSFYPRLTENAKLGLHTLVLLDIKVKEPDLELLGKTGRVRYLEPRFMTVSQCARQMLEVEEAQREGVCGPDVLAVGVARVGAGNMKIVAGTLGELARTAPRGVDFGDENQQDEDEDQDEEDDGEGDGKAKKAEEEDEVTADLGPPLHSLVIIGRRGHDMEREFLEEYAVDREKFNRIWREGYGKQI